MSASRSEWFTQRAPGRLVILRSPPRRAPGQSGETPEPPCCSRWESLQAAGLPRLPLLQVPVVASMLLSQLLRMLSHRAIGVGVREQGLWDAVSALKCHQSSLLRVCSCGLAVTLSRSLRMVLSSDYAGRTPIVFSAHRPAASPRTSQAEVQTPQKLKFEKCILNFLN